ncbi:hypothetical protein [Flexibacter flexilis]|nr:hypothetical protein [Flexibacter flexilis]
MEEQRKMLHAYMEWHKQQGYISHKDSDIDEFLASYSPSINQSLDKLSDEAIKVQAQKMTTFPNMCYPDTLMEIQCGLAYEKGAKWSRNILMAEIEQRLGNVNLFLDYLDAEIVKANNFGSTFQHKENDLNAAAKWYCIAEALLVAKEKAVEILKVHNS